MTSNLGGIVRTVLGDIPAADLGRCDYHDHMFQVSPLLPGDELDDEAASGVEAATMASAGIDAMIEATPTGLGRHPAAVARISRRSGLKIIHVTGAHHQGHYGAGHWLTDCDVDQLTRRFVRDVIVGIPADDDAPDATVPDQPDPSDRGLGGGRPGKGGPGEGGLSDRGPGATSPDGQPVRAGMVKAGVGYWRISPFERRVLEAAGATALVTGVAMMVHLDYGAAAWEVLRILGGLGLEPNRVVLAHIDRNLDPGLHAELTSAGAYIGYDGMARHREAPDSALIDCIARTLADGGDPDRILLGADVARRSRYIAYGGMPGLVYLPLRFIPRLRHALGDSAVDGFLTTNPARLLALAADSN